LSSQSKNQSIFSRLSLNGRLVFIEQAFFSVLVMLIINTVMLFNGFFEDVGELNNLLLEGHFVESIAVNVLYLLMHSSFSEQWLIGLCWLIFLIFPVRRAAVRSQKIASAFCEKLQSFISFNYHGCRAPPQVNG